MAKRISIGLALAFTAVLTHGMVYSATHLASSELMPPFTYQGFFAKLLFVTWGAWAHVHGFEPMSHMNDFGRFYVRLVVLGCPLIGFEIFRFGWREKISGQLWKPLAIAIVFMPLGGLIGSAAGEAARGALVLALMIWSVGAIRISGRPQKPMEEADITELHSSIANSR